MENKRLIKKQFELEDEIATLEREIYDLQNEIDNFDLSDHVKDDDYDTFLDDCTGEVSIGSLSYSASEVLKAVDPIAYRCGFSDYVDGLDVEDFDAYVELKDDLESKQEELDEKKEELEELIEEQEED
jgi:predicted nuclease with TOPRIM domain